MGTEDGRTFVSPPLRFCVIHGVFIESKPIMAENTEIGDDPASGNRLGTCETCRMFPAKYTCPRCEVKSCCVTCVKNHKEHNSCSGERDKTAFKRISEFTNLDLLSDYRMLEETTRSVENYKRDPSKYFTRWNRSLPIHLHRLREAVFHRGSKLLYLPQNFMRHKKNTTYFDWKTRKISWHIEWVFPQADTKTIDEKAPEEARMSTLINKYLDCKSCPDDLKEKLQFYQSASLLELSLLLKAECIKNSSAKFYEIDPSMTLKDALKNKTLIEFPTIYVVFNSHKEMFEVINSDDEGEENECTPYRVTDGRLHDPHVRHYHAQRPSKRAREKNFLFNGSDSDDSYSDDCTPAKRHSNAVKNESGFTIPPYHELIQQNQ